MDPQQVYDVHLRAAREAFDVIKREMTRPSVVYRPSLRLDGNKWMALYGADLMDGVAGFGDTPAEAMAAFDKAWASERPPRAARG